MADRIGLTRNYVSAVEPASIGADAWRLGLLADALEVPFGWLLSRSAEPLRIVPHPHLIHSFGPEVAHEASDLRS